MLIQLFLPRFGEPVVRVDEAEWVSCTIPPLSGRDNDPRWSAVGHDVTSHQLELLVRRNQVAVHIGAVEGVEVHDVVVAVDVGFEDAVVARHQLRNIRAVEVHVFCAFPADTERGHRAEPTQPNNVGQPQGIREVEFVLGEAEEDRPLVPNGRIIHGCFYFHGERCRGVIGVHREGRRGVFCFSISLGVRDEKCSEHTVVRAPSVNYEPYPLATFQI